MTDNTIPLYSHERMVSQLYSLTGPQENLPSILMKLLSEDYETIKQKLTGKKTFSKAELTKIQERFHNAVLQLSMTA